LAINIAIHRTERTKSSQFSGYLQRTYITGMPFSSQCSK
jgi:hypothetical protein